MNEAVVTIKATESELDCLIWSFTVIKTTRLPLDPEWKKPYKALLKDMRAIKEKLREAKMNNINDQKKEKSGQNIQEAIAKAQGTYVAGCKDGDCD